MHGRSRLVGLRVFVLLNTHRCLVMKYRCKTPVVRMRNRVYYSTVQSTGVGPPTSTLLPNSQPDGLLPAADFCGEDPLNATARWVLGSLYVNLRAYYCDCSFCPWITRLPAWNKVSRPVQLIRQLFSVRCRLRSTHEARGHKYIHIYFEVEAEGENKEKNDPRETRTHFLRANNQ